MKKKSILFLAISLLAVGCAEERVSDFCVDKPASIDMNNFLNSYDVLKNYVPQNDMLLTMAIKPEDFTAKNTLYSLAISNFNAVAVKEKVNMATNMNDDGTTDLMTLSSFAEEADASGLKIIGPAVVSHRNQKGKQLRSLYDDVYIPGEHIEGEVVIQDFEGFELGDDKFNFTGAGNAKIENDPKGKSGKVIHAYGANSGSFVKIPVKLPEGKTLGDYDNISFDMFVYAGGWGWGVHFGINDNEPVNSGKGPFGWGCPDHDWGRGTITYELSNLNLSDADKQLNEFYFVTGPATGSGEYLIDNVKLYVNRDLPGQIIVKTPEERTAIVDEWVGNWTKALMASSVGRIDTWDVVEDPMSDNDDEMLRMSTSPADDEYYYNEYLGNDYVRNIVTKMRENAIDTTGTPIAIKTFVNEYGLEKGNKCDRLIKQISEWDSQGTVIDGIGVKLFLEYNTDELQQANNESAIRTMLKKLAATGKLIRISALDVRMIDNGVQVASADISEADQFRISAFINKVIRMYMTEIPAPQRYALTLWSPIENSNAQNVGLWNSGFNRKITYTGVATALSGKDAPSEAVSQ